MYQVYNISDASGTVVYVGVTKSSKGYVQRFKEHCNAAKSSTKESNLLLHRAMREQGVSNFTVELLEENVPREKVSEQERFYVSKFNTYYINGNGYNMTLGGFGNIGYVFTEEVKHKQSKSSKEYWRKLKSDPVRFAQLRQQRSESMKGIPKTEEHKRKLSEIGRTKVGLKNPFYGKKHTLTARNKVSEANGARVDMVDIITGEVIHTFQSAVKAGDYLIDKGLTKNKWANSRILEVCHGQAKTAYGYVWRFNLDV